MNKQSDYIEYDIALNKGLKLLKDDKKCIFGFFIVFSINTGTRIGDTLNIKHSDLRGDTIILTENKTKKVIEITINNVIKQAYGKLIKKLEEIHFKYDENDFIFKSQKGTVYSPQSVNVLLKKIFTNKNLQISSHSLRKSFCLKIYTNMHEREHALVLLSDILSHANLSITKEYLGIHEEKVRNVYLELE
jgi:site-specific recombinase XerD